MKKLFVLILIGLCGTCYAGGLGNLGKNLGGKLLNNTIQKVTTKTETKKTEVNNYTAKVSDTVLLPCFEAMFAKENLSADSEHAYQLENDVICVKDASNFEDLLYYAFFKNFGRINKYYESASTRRDATDVYWDVIKHSEVINNVVNEKKKAMLSSNKAFLLTSGEKIKINSINKSDISTDLIENCWNNIKSKNYASYKVNSSSMDNNGNEQIYFLGYKNFLEKVSKNLCRITSDNNSSAGYSILLNYDVRQLASKTLQAKTCKGLGGFILGETTNVSLSPEKLAESRYWIKVADFKGFGKYDKSAMVKVTPFSHIVIGALLEGPKRNALTNSKDYDSQLDKETIELLSAHYNEEFKLDELSTVFYGYPILYCKFSNDVALNLNAGYDDEVILDALGCVDKKSIKLALGYKSHYICCKTESKVLLDKFKAECEQVKRNIKNNHENQIEQKLKNSDLSGLN